jgi:hypothetical protein
MVFGSETAVISRAGSSRPHKNDKCHSYEVFFRLDFTSQE